MDLYQQVRKYLLMALKEKDLSLYMFNVIFSSLAISGLKDEEVWALLFGK